MSSLTWCEPRIAPSLVAAITYWRDIDWTREFQRNRNRRLLTFKDPVIDHSFAVRFIHVTLVIVMAATGVVSAQIPTKSAESRSAAPNLMPPWPGGVPTVPSSIPAFHMTGLARQLVGVWHFVPHGHHGMGFRRDGIMLQDGITLQDIQNEPVFHDQGCFWRVHGNVIHLYDWNGSPAGQLTVVSMSVDAMTFIGGDGTYDARRTR